MRESQLRQGGDQPLVNLLPPPLPGHRAFVKRRRHGEKGQVLAGHQAMKRDERDRAEFDGVVEGRAGEERGSGGYGQPLFRIRCGGAQGVSPRGERRHMLMGIQRDPEEILPHRHPVSAGGLHRGAGAGRAPPSATNTSPSMSHSFRGHFPTTQ